MIAPIERRMWKLERRGPRWKQPSLSQVLANVPFLSDVPERALEWFRCAQRAILHTGRALSPHD